MDSSFVGLLAFAALMVIIFLIFREVVCWYWKINERKELQKKILEKLEHIESLLENKTGK